MTYDYEYFKKAILYSFSHNTQYLLNKKFNILNFVLSPPVSLPSSTKIMNVPMSSKKDCDLLYNFFHVSKCKRIQSKRKLTGSHFRCILGVSI